jgi:hypothetical protein
MVERGFTLQARTRLVFGFGFSLAMACQSQPLSVSTHPMGPAGSAGAGGSGAGAASAWGSGAAGGVAEGTPCPAAQTRCGTACVDEATDPQNCGGCGLACDHCTNGRCIRVLASGQPHPYFLAVTTSEVVWENSGDEIVVAGQIQFQGAAILKVPIGGGAPEMLVTTAQSDTVGPGGRRALAVDSGYVYWAKVNYDSGDGAIMKTPLAGGVSTSLAPTAFINDIVVSGGVVYWTAQSGIMSAPTSGGPPVVVASPGGPLTVAAGKAYWLDGAGNSWAVRTRELTPGAAEVTLTAWNTPGSPVVGCPLVPPSDFSIYGLVASTRDLYWYGDTDGGGCLMKVPLSGGTPSSIYTSAGAGGVAVDADSIYWFDREPSPSSSPPPQLGSFRILKAPLAGGSPITLACASPTSAATTSCPPSSPSLSEVFSIVVDDTSVYFADIAAGYVVKVTPK